MRPTTLTPELSSREKLTKIIQAVTMAVLVALGEAKKFSEEEEEENGKQEGLMLCMKALIVLIGCVCCYLIPIAAILRIKRLRVEKKRRKEGMAEEHSEVMEQRVEELAEMRQGAMSRRENLLQRNVLEKEEENGSEEKEENAPEEEKTENAPGEEEKKDASKEEETQEESEEEESKTNDECSSSSSSELEEPNPQGPRSRRIPNPEEPKGEEEGQKDQEKKDELILCEDSKYLFLGEEGLWKVVKESAMLEDEYKVLVQGEDAPDATHLKNERVKAIFAEFKEKMHRPTAQLADGFGHVVGQWEKETDEELQDSMTWEKASIFEMAIWMNWNRRRNAQGASFRRSKARLRKASKKHKA